MHEKKDNEFNFNLNAFNEINIHNPDALVLGPI